MKRLFAFDLDGTIAPSGDRRIPAATLDSIDELRAQGNLIAFVTGRRQVDIAPILDQVTHADYLGLNNGALIYKPGEEDQPLLHYYVPPVAARMLIEECLRADYVIDVMMSDGWFANFITEGDREYAAKIGQMPKLFTDVEEIDLEHVEGFMIMNIIDEARELIEQNDLEIQCVVSEPRCADVMHRDASKLLALELICRDAGFEMSQVVAVGNYTNDIEMITHAGIGVAVADSLPAVCEAADIVLAARHDENPVAELIEHLRDEDA